MDSNTVPNIAYIKQLGIESESLFLEHAKQLEADITHTHLLELKPEHNFAAFVAYDSSNTPIGGVYSHICFGPFPYIPTILKFGSIWGHWGNPHVLSKLIRHAVCYLRPFGVVKILSYAYTDEHFNLFQSLNFVHSNALRCDLTKIPDIEIPEVEGVTVGPVGPEYDSSRYEHWMRMWKDNGVTSFKPNSKEITFDFLKIVRASHGYQTIGAFKDGKLIGSASLNDFFGVEPCKEIGGGWAVYVLPEYRRHGIGTKIACWILKYFKDKGYKSIRILYASEDGRRIYQRKGFEKSNFLIMEYKNIQQCFDPFICDVKVTKDIYELAIPGQLKALGCTDRQSKFTGESFRKVYKSMGRKFHIDELRKQKEVGNKFDHLAQYWEDSAAGMEYEAVFDWIAKTYKAYSINDNKTVLDLCCGVGLPGQMLRMLGYKGKIIGCDISKEMLKKAAERGCYDVLFIQDANEGIKIFDESVDVIVTMGSMELLDSKEVMKHCKRVLKKGGEMWVSFQWKKGGDNPTEHQKLKEFSEEEISEMMKSEGFSIEGSFDKYDKAYLVPKPTDNDTILVPVPFIFVRAIKL